MFRIRLARSSNECDVPVPAFLKGLTRPPMQTLDIDYRADAVNLRGFLAYDETIVGQRPGVLVFHEGLGLGDFVMARARRLAELGYVAFAADMFGDRRPGGHLGGE